MISCLKKEHWMFEAYLARGVKLKGFLKLTVFCPKS